MRDAVSFCKLVAGLWSGVVCEAKRSWARYMDPALLVASFLLFSFDKFSSSCTR